MSRCPVPRLFSVGLDDEILIEVLPVPVVSAANQLSLFNWPADQAHLSNLQPTRRSKLVKLEDRRNCGYTSGSFSIRVFGQHIAESDFGCKVDRFIRVLNIVAI